MTEEFSPDGELADLGWVAGVDYLAPWRRANAAAEVLNSAMERAGWDLRVMRARAHVLANGEGVVYFRVEAAEALLTLAES